jgi:biotin carboxylase
MSTVAGRTIALVRAGYEGKRLQYARMAELGVRIVLLDEPGHWSESLVQEGLVERWLPVAVTGDPDTDAAAVLDALAGAGVQPDGVVTIWEESTDVAARVALALGLPGNPPEAVDAARSKVRTRELCAELGLPSPRAWRVRSLDELYAAAGHVGFPAVVKPEFGRSQFGTVRVDDLDSLPTIYTLVRAVTRPETHAIFRVGNDLLLEEYMDGVEFDVDLLMHDGRCVFSSVSQNWPTAEPSFQETGLHCPADHDKRAVRRLVDLVIRTVQAFGLHSGVLHVEGKCTSRGPRIVEINARLGGGRVWQYVRDVWGVNLVDALVYACLGLPPAIRASRRPQCAVVDTIVHAPASGRLAAIPFGTAEMRDGARVDVDLEAEVGDAVDGPEAIFASVLAEVSVVAKDLRTARKLAAEVLRDPPVVQRTG